MRAWTLAISIVVHLGFIAGAVVAPLFATDELPVPPRITEFVRVVAGMPQPPAAPRPPRPAQPSSDAAPLQPPDAVIPEVPREAELLPPPPSPAPPPPPAPVRVGGIIRAPQKVHDVAPRYPVVAQQSRVQGVVILEAVISEDGAVRSLRVLRSQPLLDAAAVEAVRQWRFTPTLLNGQPVPVVMTVTVNFSLN